MAERKNPMQGVVDGLVGEYKNSKLAARTNGVIPLGQKQVSIDQASKEFAAMSPEQRQTTMNKIGPIETMKLVRHLGGQSG